MGAASEVGAADTAAILSAGTIDGTEGTPVAVAPATTGNVVDDTDNLSSGGATVVDAVCRPGTEGRGVVRGKAEPTKPIGR